MNDQQTAAYIRALLEERDHCIAQGLAARVVAITVELARVGHEAAPPVKRTTRRTTR